MISVLLLVYFSGQIRSRPHTTDFPQKVAFWKGHPLISGKIRLVKYYNLARFFQGFFFANLRLGGETSNIFLCSPRNLGK